MKIMSLKRLVSGLLAALMVLTLLPTSAWAGEGSEDSVASGTCGDNLTWVLDSAGTLTISGTGEMWDRGIGDSTPWSSYENSISRVTINSGVTSIGYGAFSDCDSLTSVSIPNSVTSIGDYAFSDCDSLTSITIPSSVSSIGDYAFNWCTGLSSVTISSGVISIGDRAFYECDSLTSVTIPNSVTSIGDVAFSDCDSLTDVSMGSGVTSIGYGVFRDCSSLTAIQVASGNLNYSSSSGVLFNKAKTELLCYPVGRSGSYTIPNSVTGIGKEAFYDCTNLTSVTIPNSVTSIGGFAFYECDSLTSVTIPNSVISIGDRAFCYCSKLSNITLPGSLLYVGRNVLDNTAYYKDKSNWENGILYAGKYLLDARLWITTASIRSGTSLLASGAFMSCDSLSSVSIPDSVAAIGAFAFYGCSSLTSISIPASVNSIGYRVFADCESLQTIRVVSGNPTYSSDSAGVLFNKGKTRLICCPGGFAGSYTIPGSVTSISDYAFYDCTGLTSISIPNSVTSIGDSAFSGCNSLTDVYYTGSQTQWNKITIEAYNAPLLNATIHYNNAVTPAAPKVSSSIVTSTGCIKLTWSAVDNAEKYYIYRSTDGGKNYKYYDSTTKTTYTNVSVTPGKNYYYKIKAIASDGTASEYSNAVYRTADCAKPVVKISTAASSGAIKLKWDKVTGASKYEIYRATGKNGTFYKYDTTTSTSYTNVSVTPGKTYYYKVKAICGKSSYGNSAFSTVVSRTADCARPVVKISNVASSGAIKLKWDKVTGASKYEIYRATGKNGSYSKYTTVTGTSWTNKSVTPGKTYYYKVKAICGKSSYGNSAFSAVVSRTADCARPDVTISRSGGKPLLKWKAITSATEYVVYRSGYRDGTYTKLCTTTELSYINSSAKAGYTYYYKVKAICGRSSYGNSAYSSIVSIKSK